MCLIVTAAEVKKQEAKDDGSKGPKLCKIVEETKLVPARNSSLMIHPASHISYPPLSSGIYGTTMQTTSYFDNEPGQSQAKKKFRSFGWRQKTKRFEAYTFDENGQNSKWENASPT